MKAGEVAAFDDILKSLFGLTATAAARSRSRRTNPSSLITTARTYNQHDVRHARPIHPGVTPNEAVGNGEGSLQLLQLEQAIATGRNIGLAETSGHAATVEVLLFLPDSKVTPVYTVPLTRTSSCSSR